MVLIEKDWVSMGHKFLERCGHLSSEKIFHDNTIGIIEKRKLKQRSKYLYNDIDDLETNDTSTTIDDFNILNSDFLKNTFNVGISKNNNKNLKFVSPVFQQFLDCVYQLLLQNPTRFEFNERFLRRLVYHLYACQYGTFLCNNEKERNDYHIKEKTRPVWDYFLSRRMEFTNPIYKKENEEDECIEDWILSLIHI